MLVALALCYQCHAVTWREPVTITLESVTDYDLWLAAQSETDDSVDYVYEPVYPEPDFYPVDDEDQEEEEVE